MPWRPRGCALFGLVQAPMTKTSLAQTVQRRMRLCLLFTTTLRGSTDGGDCAGVNKASRLRSAKTAPDSEDREEAEQRSSDPSSLGGRLRLRPRRWVWGVGFGVVHVRQLQHTPKSSALPSPCIPSASWLLCWPTPELAGPDEHGWLLLNSPMAACASWSPRTPPPPHKQWSTGPYWWHTRLASVT